MYLAKDISSYILARLGTFVDTDVDTEQSNSEQDYLWNLYRTHYRGRISIVLRVQLLDPPLSD